MCTVSASGRKAPNVASAHLCLSAPLLQAYKAERERGAELNLCLAKANMESYTLGRRVDDLQINARMHFQEATQVTQQARMHLDAMHQLLSEKTDENRALQNQLEAVTPRGARH